MRISLVFALSFPLAGLGATVPLPSPPISNVHITNFPLTDHSRVDPYAPCCNKPRRLMLTLFQPANCSSTVPIAYMPNGTATFYDVALASVGVPDGAFESLRLKTCSSPPKKTDFPLLLFSTGAGMSRLLYNVICQWVASAGFNVVSIDHTYDAATVEFPNGDLITGADIELPDGLAKLVKVRIADVLSTLNALSNTTFTKQAGIPNLKTKRVGAFGHSLGGATAADAMLADPRIVAGLNMDGSVYGQALNKTQDQPFAIFAGQGHNQGNDDTWAIFWQQLTGRKLQLEINGTAHGSFDDYPILAQSIGLNGTATPEIATIIGTIDGVRILTILRSYIAGFFQEALEEKKVDLLKGPSAKFPEVAFANISSGIANDA
jgi:dienelactone hydrolase